MKKKLVIILISVLCFSCKKAVRKFVIPEIIKVENCSNETVKQILSELLKEKLTIYLTLSKNEGVINLSSALLEDFTSKEQITTNLRIEIEKFLDNRSSNLSKEEKLQLKETIEQINNNFKEISDTRTTSENKNLKICECKGSIVFENNYKFNLSYSVQETETHYYVELLDVTNQDFIVMMKNLDLELKKSKLKVNDKKEKEVIFNFSNNIRSFVEAEDSRNFYEIYSHFSKKMNRYYNLKNPKMPELKNLYEKTWNSISNSKNIIQSIKRIDYYNYNLNTTFKYYHNRKNIEVEKTSSVRIVFNDIGKIIEIYGIK